MEPGERHGAGGGRGSNAEGRRTDAGALASGATHGWSSGWALATASRCGLTTGLSRSFLNGKTVPWVYRNWPHIGATVWSFFATLGVNPNFVRGQAVTHEDRCKIKAHTAPLSRTRERCGNGLRET